LNVWLINIRSQQKHVPLLLAKGKLVNQWNGETISPLNQTDYRGGSIEGYGFVEKQVNIQVECH